MDFAASLTFVAVVAGSFSTFKHGLEIARMARDMHGGNGISEESPVNRHMRGRMTSMR